jgi:hypothetical protein
MPRLWRFAAARTVSFRHIELRMGTVHPPESLNRKVFGSRAFPDNSQDPAINVALVFPEERFERFHVSGRESSQKLHFPLYQSLLSWCPQGYTQFSGTAVQGVHGRTALLRLFQPKIT